jgi:hypothetical protein
MTEEDGRALWTLRSKWLGLYQVSLVALVDGIWRARRFLGELTLLAGHLVGNRRPMVRRRTALGMDRRRSVTAGVLGPSVAARSWGGSRYDGIRGECGASGYRAGRPSALGWVRR